MKIKELKVSQQKYLIVIGVHKAGTTSLYKYLSEQPLIFRPEKKELHFFTPYVYNNLTIDVSGYNDLFKGSKADEILLDISPSYIYGKARLAKALSKQMDSYYIVMLRDPVSRFVSFYKQSLKRGEIKKSMSLSEFYELSKLEFESGVENNIYVNRALREGCYSIYLKDWINIANKDLKIVFFENFITNPESELNDIYDWLKLGRPIKRHDYSVENSSFVPYYTGIHQIILKLYSVGEQYFRKFDRIISVIKPVYVKLIGSNKLQQINPSDLIVISSFYSSYNEELRSILSQYDLDLPKWLSK